MADKPQNEWDKKELGALWSRTKKNTTEKFLTGKINLKNYGFDKDIDVVIFKNKNKEKDNHPDLKIYFSEPRAAGAPATAPRTPAAKPTTAAAPVAPAPDDELI